MTNVELIKLVKNKHYKYLNYFGKNDFFFDDGRRIIPKKYPKKDNMDGTYCHIITRDYDENSQVPCYFCLHDTKCNEVFDYNPLLNDDKPRKICPFRIATLDFTNFFTSDLKIWKKRVHTELGYKNRILCYNDLTNYLIILEEKGNKILLWTAYHIEFEHEKRSLIGEYNKYMSEIGVSHNISKKKRKK